MCLCCVDSTVEVELLACHGRSEVEPIRPKEFKRAPRKKIKEYFSSISTSICFCDWSKDEGRLNSLLTRRNLNSRCVEETMVRGHYHSAIFHPALTEKKTQKINWVREENKAIMKCAFVLCNEVQELAQWCIDRTQHFDGLLTHKAIPMLSTILKMWWSILFLKDCEWMKCSIYQVIEMKSK